jgi:hypothetical protein
VTRRLGNNGVRGCKIVLALSKGLSYGGGRPDTKMLQDLLSLFEIELVTFSKAASDVDFMAVARIGCIPSNVDSNLVSLSVDEARSFCNEEAKRPYLRVKSDSFPIDVLNSVKDLVIEPCSEIKELIDSWRGFEGEDVESEVENEESY